LPGVLALTDHTFELGLSVAAVVAVLTIVYAAVRVIWRIAQGDIEPDYPGDIPWDTKRRRWFRRWRDSS
jgi:hypothetical protein